MYVKVSQELRNLYSIGKIYNKKVLLPMTRKIYNKKVLLPMTQSVYVTVNFANNQIYPFI